MEKLLQLSSIFANFSIFIAAALGGLWGIYRFKISRENKPTPQIDLDYKVLSYDNKSNLLVLGVYVSNIGKYNMYPRSISLSIKSLPKDALIGSSPHWHDGHLILDKFDVILDSNPDMKSEEINDYMLPSNDKYIEVVTLVISKEERFLMAKVSYLDKIDNDFSIYKFLQV